MARSAGVNRREAIMRGLFAVVVAGLVLFASGHAEAATPTPMWTATATATPSAAIPTAPTNVHFGFGVRSVTWSDNSDNEAGFRITLRVHALEGDQGRTLDVAANSTSFEFPADFTFGCGASIE